MLRGGASVLACILLGLGSAAAALAQETDTDGDGLSDLMETTGWEILVDEHGWNDSRLVARRQVTSDPTLLDTDVDGLDDYVEFLIGSDPRRADSDGDGLADAAEWNQWMTSPVAADSDGDCRGPDHDLPPNPTLFDGFELSIVGTSPTLDDTDGDGRTDAEEFDDPLYSPLVAELPEYKVTLLGPVDVRLNVEYAEAVGQESQYGTTLMTSETTTDTRGGEVTASFETGLSVMVGAEFGFPSSSASTEVTVDYRFGMETTLSWEQESSQTAQQEYSKFVTDSLTRTETAASGSISLGVVVTNTGLTAFEISTLGLAARQWQPRFDKQGALLDGSQFKTVATLMPDLDGITLAPFSSSPELRVAAENVDATLIKEFLANPTSLHFGTVALEILDENGINFDFLIQKTLPRTALVVIDFGDGRLERYRVATNVARAADGEFLGIPMAAVLEILEVPYETRLEGDYRFLTSVRGTAEALPYRGWSYFLEFWENTYDAPDDFVLQAPPSSVYGTFLARDTLSARDVAAVFPGVELRAGRQVVLEDGFSVATDATLEALVDPALAVDVSDFEAVPLHAADTITLAYAKDADLDGLVHFVEELYGTLDVDSSSIDTDGDGREDDEEVREGWPVKLRDSSGDLLCETDPDDDPLRVLPECERVYSDPRSADADEDGLGDADERQAGTDPSRPDTDGDGLDDGYEYARVVFCESDPNAICLPRYTQPRLYVDTSSTTSDPMGTSWSSSFPELADALAEAGDRLDTPDLYDDVSEIWVARGVYRPDPVASNRNLSFELQDHVGVFGGFRGFEERRDARDSNPLSNGTVLSGDLGEEDEPSDNSYHVVRAVPRGVCWDPNTGVEGSSCHSDHHCAAQEVCHPGICSVSGTPCTNSWEEEQCPLWYEEDCDWGPRSEILLDGFTITGGNADYEPTDSWEWLDEGGGGIVLKYAHAELRNLLVWRNRAEYQTAEMAAPDYRGGGAFAEDGSVDVRSSLFVENEGLALRVWNADVSIVDSWFADNPEGGVVLGRPNYGTRETELVVKASTFMRNGVQGALVCVEPKVEIHSSRFEKNWSKPRENLTLPSWAKYGGLAGGVSLLRGARALVTQSVFWQNEFRSTDGCPYISGCAGGGAIAATYPLELDIVNSTFVDNRTFDDGSLSPYSDYEAAGAVTGWSVAIKNSVFVKNLVGAEGSDDDQIAAHPELSGTTPVQSSCIDSLEVFDVLSAQNVQAAGADPNTQELLDFVSADAGNLRLSGVSPCIDAGYPFADWEPWVPGLQLPPWGDIDGFPRVVDGNGDGTAVIDAGACEFQY